jgi:hypothetical protein
MRQTKRGACIDAPLLNSSLTGVQTNETKFKLKNKNKKQKQKLCATEPHFRPLRARERFVDLKTKPNQTKTCFSLHHNNVFRFEIAMNDASVMHEIRSVQQSTKITRSFLWDPNKTKQ